jgi:hypothetical protein
MAILRRDALHFNFVPDVERIRSGFTDLFPASAVAEPRVNTHSVSPPPVSFLTMIDIDPWGFTNFTHV